MTLPICDFRLAIGFHALRKYVSWRVGKPRAQMLIANRQSTIGN